MKKTILINDGISDLGKQRLIKYNFKIIDKHIHQNELITFINEGSSSRDVLLIKIPKLFSLCSGGSNSPLESDSLVIDLNLNKRKGSPFNPALT